MVVRAKSVGGVDCLEASQNADANSQPLYPGGARVTVAVFASLDHPFTFTVIAGIRRPSFRIPTTALWNPNRRSHVAGTTTTFISPARPLCALRRVTITSEFLSSSFWPVDTMRTSHAGALHRLPPSPDRTGGPGFLGRT